MSFIALTLIMAALAIVLFAILGRALWLIMPRQQSGRRVAAPATTGEAREAAAPFTPPDTPPAPELTRLPTARVQGERRRRIKPASLGGGDRTPHDKVMGSDIHSETVFRLEQSFDLLEAGRISLETYLDEVEVLRRSCQMENEKLRRMVAAGRMSEDRSAARQQAIDDALEAVRWCADWAAAELHAARAMARAAVDAGPGHDDGSVAA